MLANLRRAYTSLVSWSWQQSQPSPSRFFPRTKWDSISFYTPVGSHVYASPVCLWSPYGHKNRLFQTVTTCLREGTWLVRTRVRPRIIRETRWLWRIIWLIRRFRRSLAFWLRISPPAVTQGGLSALGASIRLLYEYLPSRMWFVYIRRRNFCKSFFQSITCLLFRLRFCL